MGALESIENFEEVNELKVLSDEQILPENSEFCEHIELCKKPCFVNSERAYCGVFKFYERYGINWRENLSS